MKSYERVVALSPDSWRGLLNYSVALVGLGREAEAKQALRRAFRLSGDSLHRCLATCLSNRHKGELGLLLGLLIVRHSMVPAGLQDCDD